MAEDNGQKEIAITYETLYEFLIREKNKSDIQKLDDDFVSSVKKYLEEKRDMLYKTDGQQMLFSEEEQKKTLQQISNIIKIIRELYGRREKKIINLAINMSKTNSSAIDVTNLLEEERSMFNALVNILNFNRANILCNMIDEARAKDLLSRVDSKAVQSLNKDVKGAAKSKNNLPSEKEDSKGASSEEKTDSSEMIKVRFKEKVDKFIDPKLKVYGPFGPGQEAELPSVVADVLLKKDKAEIV
jgi:DNA replication initiation complex subunit (GINS family)